MRLNFVKFEKKKWKKDFVEILLEQFKKVKVQFAFGNFVWKIENRISFANLRNESKFIGIEFAFATEEVWNVVYNGESINWKEIDEDG
jgi:hypothetical protein